MAEQTDESLLREVDEELRQEQFQNAWKKYGKMILGAATAFVVVIAGYQFWQAQDLKQRLALGDRFVNAQQLALNGDLSGAVAAFQTLSSEDDGYGLLAQFQSARLKAASGDTAGAMETYRSISDKSDTPKLYKDLAIVLGANLEINDDSVDGAAIKTKLTPLSTPGNPWRFTVKELLAALALKDGDANLAKSVYEELSKDSATPAAMRQRATEMLTILR